MTDPRNIQPGITFKNPLLSSSIVILLVYVVLFEFVLPENRILPKPSLLIESFPALFSDYNIPGELAITTTIVYLSMLLAYVIISFAAPVLINIFLNYDGIINGLKLFRYFPAFFYAILFAFWFPFSLAAEFFFSFIASLFFLGVIIFQNTGRTKPEYIFTALNLGASEKKVYKDVVWKSVQPDVFHSLKRLHYYLWVLVLIYEYIGNSAGIGYLYSVLFEYMDFAALFAVAVVVSILICLGNFLIDFFENKLIYWEP